MKRAFIFTLLILCTLISEAQSPFRAELCKAAKELTLIDVVYDPGYYVLDYPMGDIPANRGVCTDVLIRTYRSVGIDLQEKVHIDMKLSFDTYPDIWGLNYPDKNIDHRRVPNLMVFFEKFGESLNISNIASDYKPGDIVCWNLGGGITHIGIVSDIESSDGLRFNIIHNIGEGQVVEDCLFKYKIIGHYYYE